MPMFATSYYQTEIDEMIGMGFSTKALKVSRKHNNILQIMNKPSYKYKAGFFT